MTPDLGSKLDELLINMITEVTKEGSTVSLEERLKVFKIASQHHAAMRKINKGKDGDGGGDGTGNDMNALRAQVNGTDQGPPGTPSKGDEDGEQA